MNMHPEIATLSRHLHSNLRSLRGRVNGPPRRFSPALLIPVAIVAGAAVLLTVSPKARKSLLLKVMMVVSTHLLQDKADDDIGTGTEAYDPRKN
ncbi:MAG: hypothetical protein ACO1PZ_10260 [Gammaproteobacteria bacterium]